MVSDYLGTYGPAEPEEFAGWFDLRPPLAKQAFQRVTSEMPEAPDEDTVRLLPAFDPYTIGVIRQLETVSSGPEATVSRPQGWISPVVLVNGPIEGTWEPGPEITLFRDQPDWVGTALAALGRLGS